ncbi:glycosyltransferase 87 family protein [Streptacidiphilus griseoplanus]|uniref:glycosyltransferase 87 family protein n=1 Tax=Peterkaempfera griseoplana TaxID=66896 RepID=UPI0007C70438|nr:glycosyltransferase 87 family protein [Peterkaempfera griseoplana]
MELAEPGRDRTLEPPHEEPPQPRTAAGPLWALGLSFVATRVLIVLMCLGVWKISGLDVTGDVSVIYHGWYEVLKTGTFPMDDVTWQYPPGAALVMLAPGLLPWSYLTDFMVLTGVFDVLAMLLLVRAGVRGRRRYAGAWLWVAAVPMLGPTVYARYDLIVTAVAVAGLLALGRRRSRLAGVLLGFGGLLKVWPLLAVIGTARGSRTRRAWIAAAVTAAGAGFLVAAAMNGAFRFLTFQRDRGVEIESLAALPIHWARTQGKWQGQVTLNYGSVEFLGPWVHVIAQVSMATTVLAFGWLLVWRLRARVWHPATPYDAALAALLLFTVTSRVISPQYLVWLIGLAAVCLTARGTTQKPVAVLVLLASALTVLEFPVRFNQVAASDPGGVALLTARNVLLLGAALLSCGRLWRSTMGRAEEEDPAEEWDGLPDPEAATRIGDPFEAETVAYTVRPGIAYEQHLLEDLDPDHGPSSSRR